MLDITYIVHVDIHMISQCSRYVFMTSNFGYYCCVIHTKKSNYHVSTAY